MENNTTLRIPKKGHYDGDLYVRLSVGNNNSFKRTGQDAFSDLEVPVIDLILGATKEVETIYGRKANLYIPPGTQANKKLKLANEGFYKPNTNIKGDHFVEIKPKIPTALSGEEKKLYEQIKDLHQTS